MSSNRTSEAFHTIHIYNQHPSLALGPISFRAMPTRRVRALLASIRVAQASRFCTTGFFPRMKMSQPAGPRLPQRGSGRPS